MHRKRGPVSRTTACGGEVRKRTDGTTEDEVTAAEIWNDVQTGDRPARYTYALKRFQSPVHALPDSPLWHFAISNTRLIARNVRRRKMRIKLPPLRRHARNWSIIILTVPMLLARCTNVTIVVILLSYSHYLHARIMICLIHIRISNWTPTIRITVYQLFICGNSMSRPNTYKYLYLS